MRSLGENLLPVVRLSIYDRSRKDDATILPWNKIMKITNAFFFCYLILFGWLSAEPSPGVEPAARVRMYHCETKVISVSNVDVFKQVLHDGDGNPVSSITRGFAPVFVGSREIRIEDGEEAKVAAALARVDSWKAKPPAIDQPVGMVGEVTEALVLFVDKWWVLKSYDGKVSVAEVDLVLEKDGVRITSLIPEKKLMTSDDPGIVGVFDNVMVRVGD